MWIRISPLCEKAWWLWVCCDAVGALLGARGLPPPGARAPYGLAGTRLLSLLPRATSQASWEIGLSGLERLLLK